MGVFSLYVPILYFYIIFLHRCDERYSERLIRCGPACFYEEAPLWFELFDAFVNYITPIVLIVVIFLTLLLFPKFLFFFFDPVE